MRICLLFRKLPKFLKVRIKEDKLKKISTFQQLKNAIFHEDEKYALLQKLRNDILND